MSVDLILLLIICMFTGSLIGSVGTGGILLTPLLFYGLGMDIHVAMAASSFSFFFTGVVGTYRYQNQGLINWRYFAYLTLGIVPFAYLGAVANNSSPDHFLSLVLAIFLLGAGLHSIIQKKQEGIDHISFRTLLFMGFGIGFFSAFTGTGGPVLLIPLLMSIKYPLRKAVGVSQAIQIPLAIFASIGFLMRGQLDLELGLVLGIGQSIGVLLGVFLASKLTLSFLEYLIAGVLIISGLVMMMENIL